MNKKSFLNELEKRLNVLSEEEKKDIINEYDDIISEKVKHGKTEEEAVLEFGNIDDLVKEILSAYKINPDYNSDDFKNIIDKGIKKIEEVVNQIIGVFKNEFDSNSNSTNDIIVKVLVILLILWLIRIPFGIISAIFGNVVDSILFIDFPSRIIFKVFINIIYFILCIYIIYLVITKINDGSKNQNKDVKTDKEEIKSEKTDNKKTVKNETKKEDVKIEKINRQNNESLENVILLIVKIWCFILFVIPLFFTVLGLTVALCILIWLFIKEINIIGIIMIVSGLLFIFGGLMDLLNRFIFSKKIHPSLIITNAIISIMLVTFGVLFTVDYFVSLDKYNTLPSNVKKNIYTYDTNIKSKTKINYDNIVIDDSLDDKIKIEVEYYSDFIDIYTYNRNDYEYCDYDDDHDNCEDIFMITVDYRYKDNIVKRYSDLILKNLKENKIYNYDALDNYKVTIYVSNKYKDLIV